MDEKPLGLDNAIRIVGEVFAPGASLLMDGKILAGSAHLILGMWSRVTLGPIATGLIIANSFSTSTTGKNLLKQLATLDPSVASGGAQGTAPEASEGGENLQAQQTETHGSLSEIDWARVGGATKQS